MLLALRLLLAATFVVAAIAKLTNTRSFATALQAFGARGHLTLVMTWTIPLAELAVVALLLTESSARLGAIGAITLLLVFSASLAVALAKGRSLECRCFGPLFGSSIGWQTLVRNAIIAAAAIVVILAYD